MLIILLEEKEIYYMYGTNGNIYLWWLIYILMPAWWRTQNLPIRLIYLAYT